MKPIKPQEKILMMVLICTLIIVSFQTIGYSQTGKKEKKETATLQNEEKTKEKARNDFKKGVELFKAGKLSEALSSFQSSYSLFPHPKTLLNIANCYEVMLNFPSAIEYYNKFLKESGEEIKEEEKKDVEEKVKKLLEKVSTIEFSGEGEIEVIVDDQKGINLIAPDKIYISAGKHSIVVKKEEKIVYDKTIHSKAGEKETIKITPPPSVELTPVAPPVDKATENKPEEKKELETPKPAPLKKFVDITEETKGTLFISSTVDDSLITINGKTLGKTPIEQKLKAGNYKVNVGYPGLPSWEKIVEVHPGKTTDVEVDLKATKKKPAPYWIITASAALVSVALWSGFGLDGILNKKKAIDIRDKYNIESDEDCTRANASPEGRKCDEYNSLIDKARWEFIAADITGPLALALAGGSIALYFLVKKEKNIPQASIKVSFINPFISPDADAGGFGMTGSF